MTREEAIAILRQEREGICTNTQCTMTMYQDYSGVDKCNQDCEEREAYDMAIEALQATEHDGCEGCKYTGKDLYELPCIMCKRSQKDLWERREP